MNVSVGMTNPQGTEWRPREIVIITVTEIPLSNVVELGDSVFTSMEI